MRRVILYNTLRFTSTHRRARQLGFSLAELIVSMGILLLMLTLAGEVTNLTVRATGQARALTEVNQALRIFEQRLREDLRYVTPGNSLMVIQGNPVNAYWTQSGQESDDDRDPSNGYPHVPDPERELPCTAGCQPNLMEPPRADILMFFTVRRSTNYVQYDYTGVPPNLEQVVTSGVQQVVYGHANLIECPSDCTGFDPADFPRFPDDPADPEYPMEHFPVPAEDWHLARRVVHLLDLDSPPPKCTPKWGDATNGNLDEGKWYERDGDPNRDLLGNPAFLLGLTDVITAFDYEVLVLEALHGNEDLRGHPVLGSFPFYWPEIFRIPDREVAPFARSMLDPTPPPRCADFLGHYFLPNCASFKVEWALNPASDFIDGRLDNAKELYWVDQGAEDPLASMEAVVASTASPDLEELLSLRLAGSTLVTWNPPVTYDEQYSLRERFGGLPANIEWHSHEFGDGEHPNLAVFTATRRKATTLDPNEIGDLIPEDVFPVALRITIDMFDDERRLERPIRHVIIVPVGG